MAGALLACPSCHALVHADRLRQLASEAEEAAAREDISAQLQAWRTALDLLPAGARQRQVIAAKIDGLSREVTKGSGLGRRMGAGGGAVAGGALILWKLKALLLIAVTKGKLLLLGLTKSSTLLSMLPTFGLYWAVFGWRFAAGLIASIYVHEMGHVFALRRYGIPASAPMFIPGFGAVVRSHHHPANAHEDARIGLAGPVWGLGAAVAALAVFAAAGGAIWVAIARVGAWINLFNLLPVWQLDGARALRPLNRTQLWAALAVVVLTFAVTREGLLVLIGAVAGYQAFRATEGGEGDWGALAWYASLIVVLAWLSRLGLAAAA
ncbi:MAG: site-2 protease family protein [Acidobacteria bacterium]|nr:MAG: site-2 protease family protein [Acidobacteriota bacterium]